ncbi:MAG: IS3 family transposase [Firmicutes bacterium]|nr:IS3 family transposase [Bacillota bacterium]
MKYEFIHSHRSEFGVEKMCQVLEVSRSGYYAWLDRPKSSRQQEDEKLLVHIKQVFEKSRHLYGYLRVTRKLNVDGIKCGKNRVARLMRENGLQARTKRKFKATTNSRHDYPVAENVLGRGITVSGPNRVWVGDITYIPTDEGWLYLAAVMDLYSRQNRRMGNGPDNDTAIGHRCSTTSTGPA